jgi:alpha-L-fucosidase 2
LEVAAEIGLAIVAVAIGSLRNCLKAWEEGYGMSMSGSFHGMTMRYPATRWQDALPTGSGVVGALVYGQIMKDTILLNHDVLYYPKDPPPAVDVSDQLPAMRQLIDEGRCRDAAQLMRDVYAARVDSEAESANVGLAPYQPFCAIHLSTATDGPFRKYRRGVDFSTGRAWVEWTDNAATFTREVFVSRATDTVFVRIRGSEPGSVACRVSLNKARNEQGDAGTGVIDLSVTEQASQDNRTLTFRGCYPGGFSFGAVGHVDATGGTIIAKDDALVIEGADELVLQVRLFLGEEAEGAEGSASFDGAFAEHAALHAELFNRMTLEIGPGPELSNEEMLMDAYDGEVPRSLVQTMFEFGRYLLISSSRPGGWPANLQGIWNGDYAPAWNCDIHTDENVQMNYWLAMPGGLGETALPLFEYFESYMDQFRANALNNYGCRGILVPLAMTTDGSMTPLGYSSWTAGAGWIAQHFYDYYLFTGDIDFLKRRAVPWLKEVALFYEDFLVEGADGKLLFSPSLSPENRPSNSNSLIAMNATMDVAVCREVLGNLADACELLEIEEEGVARWRAMLPRLPDYAINDDGALREWLHPDFEDNYHHRHQSHLYPLFPGLEITEDSDPELHEACRVAAEKRLVVGLTSQTGWSMAHMANTFARLGLGDRSMECLEILTRSSMGPNLFTYHNDWRLMGLSSGDGAQPPFQIDANFGITAAILEMLVFSKPGLLKLLPALPTKLSSGRVTGIGCRGGITVDMEWNVEAKTFSASLSSNSDQHLRLRLPEVAGEVRFTPVESASRDTVRGRGYWSLSLKRGVPLGIATIIDDPHPARGED